MKTSNGSFFSKKYSQQRCMQEIIVEGSQLAPSQSSNQAQNRIHPDKHWKVNKLTKPSSEISIN